MQKIFIQLMIGCLFSVFIINSIGCYVYFEVQRKSIRHEIKHSILNKLTDNQLVRIIREDEDNRNEFEQNGVMYDVIRKEIVNGKTVLWCFEDKKETQLNRTIESTLAKGLENSPIKKTQSILINYLKITLSEFQKNKFIFLPNTPQKSIFKYLFSSIISIIAIPSPPPDFFVKHLIFPLFRSIHCI